MNRKWSRMVNGLHYDFMKYAHAKYNDDDLENKDYDMSANYSNHL